MKAKQILTLTFKELPLTRRYSGQIPTCCRDFSSSSVRRLVISDKLKNKKISKYLQQSLAAGCQQLEW